MKITINESGVVNMPKGKIMMNEYEIAELLGSMVSTVRGTIARLLKSRMCIDSSGAVVRGNRIMPDYFGLEVVIAIAMQVDSFKADVFRKFILSRITVPTQLPIYISMNDNVLIFS